MGRACDSTASSAFATLICDVATLEPEGVKLFTPRDTVPQGFKVSDDSGVGDQRREAEVLVGGEERFRWHKGGDVAVRGGFRLEIDRLRDVRGASENARREARETTTCRAHEPSGARPVSSLNFMRIEPGRKELTPM